MVKWTNAGGQTKRANERPFVYCPPAWRRWRNVKTTYWLLLSLLYKTPVAMRFPAKITSRLHLGCHTCWVSYFTLVCQWCERTASRAGGRSVGRCTVAWLPNFLGWVDYFICLPMVLRARELRYDLTNLISGSIDLFTDTAAIFNYFDLRSIIGCPCGMSTFRLYFRALFGTVFLKVFLE